MNVKAQNPMKIIEIKIATLLKQKQMTRAKIKCKNLTQAKKRHFA